MAKNLTKEEKKKIANVGLLQAIHDLKNRCTFDRVNTDCYKCSEEIKKNCNENWKENKNYPCTWELEGYDGY